MANISNGLCVAFDGLEQIIPINLAGENFMTASDYDATSLVPVLDDLIELNADIANVTTDLFDRLMSALSRISRYLA